MRKASVLAAGMVLAACGFVSAEVVFFDGFESGTSNWMGWEDVSWYPDKVCNAWCPCGSPRNCFGPFMVYQSNNHPYSGAWCGRQEQAQPWWYGSKTKDYVLPTLPSDRSIRLSVWQFEDYNKRDPFSPPGSVAHDQVQGWVALMGDFYEDETEFLALGVHAHTASPAPIEDWWHNVAWSTAAEGWNLTSPLTPRAQGFRHLEMVVHPYTGNAGDVEFFVNSTKVGEGSRTVVDGTVVPINRIAIGSSPAHMTEDYISNTYEFFWYDDVALSVQDRGDFDFDGDVDLADFGTFQSCFNGPNRPPKAASCGGADFDGDNDVDLADFGVFQGCFNGPNRPPKPGCNG